MDCLICYQATENVLEDCGHYVCSDCIGTYSRVAIEERKHEIICPTRYCDKPIPYRVISHNLDDDNIKRLDTLIAEAALGDDLTIICPDCNNRNKVEKDSTNYRCNACGNSFCIVCNEPEHDYYSRCEFSEIQEAFDSYTETKRCPKCRMIIVKEEGCDCVRCPNCKRKFCWNCLQIYKKIDSIDKHKQTCSEFRGFNNDEDTDAEDSD